MSDLDFEHVEGSHLEPVVGCSICEKDSLIDYQGSMLKMMEESYLDLVHNIDKVLKGIHAYRRVTQGASLIPYGQSAIWIPLEHGFLPFEGEEVFVLLKIKSGGQESHVRTHGYLHKNNWYSWSSKTELKGVIAWKKIRGQADLDSYKAPGMKLKP